MVAATARDVSKSPGMSRLRSVKRLWSFGRQGPSWSTTPSAGGSGTADKIISDEDSNISAGENQDRISALPDDLLLEILECLYMRTAVQTGMLSTRWRHLPRQLSS
ncbi:hypothetical protein ZWY2020_031335 [Hordeum vulgare]|nr:hypothetical protein ZWY2020_031335 [Hordeum vulgare]